jgi:hypothetical protein
MSVNPQAAFHFSHAKQGRLAYAGSETQLAILVLVHPENVGQHKINECSGVKPISNSTVFEFSLLTSFSTLFEIIARVERQRPAALTSFHSNTLLFRIPTVSSDFL